MVLDTAITLCTFADFELVADVSGQMISDADCYVNASILAKV